MNSIAPSRAPWQRLHMSCNSIATLAVVVFLYNGSLTALAQPVQPNAGGPQMVRTSERSELGLLQAAPALSIRPSTGFLDGLVWSDAGTLVYFVTDGATYIEAHVVELASKQERVLPLPATLLHPIAVQIHGPWLVIVAADDQNMKFVQWIDVTAKVSVNIKLKARRAPPTISGLDEASFVNRKGKIFLSIVHRSRKGDTLRVSIALVDPGSGKRAKNPRPIDLDQSERAAALSLQILYWSEGFTRAHGLREGKFIKANDRRGANTEAVYDVIAGTFLSDQALTDLVALSKNAETLRVMNEISFVRFTTDRSQIEIWKDGKPQTLELPLATYKTDMLSSTIESSGAVWFGLHSEPANAVALAAKKIDPALFDVYRFDPSTAALQLIRRFPAENKNFIVGGTGNLVWVAENNRGISRGSKQLDVWMVP
jgi:hypothetical protein